MNKDRFPPSVPKGIHSVPAGAAPRVSLPNQRYGPAPLVALSDDDELPPCVGECYVDVLRHYYEDLP